MLTPRKFKTILPPLQGKEEKRLRSRVVYKITCSRCQACYFTQTDCHIRTWFREHLHPSQPLGIHLRLCGVTPKFEDKDGMIILQSRTRSIPFLETLESLWQHKLKPLINTKVEYKIYLLVSLWYIHRELYTIANTIADNQSHKSSLILCNLKIVIIFLF